MVFSSRFMRLMPSPCTFLQPLETCYCNVEIRSNDSFLNAYNNPVLKLSSLEVYPYELSST